MSYFQNISGFIKRRDKACRTAMIVNILFVIFALMLTTGYLIITWQQRAMFDDEKELWTAWGLGLAFLGLVILLALALNGIARSNVLSHLFVMLIQVFAMVFSAAFGLKGILFLIFMVSALASNILCYNKLHPNNK